MRSRRVLRSAGAVAGTGVACVAWATLFERRWYATRHEQLAVLRGDRPLRVMLFSDLHLLPWQTHRLDYVRRAAQEWGPELLISAGDNLEHPDAIEPVVRLHADLVEMTGAPALAVLGGHDRKGPRFSNPAGYLRGPSEGPGGIPLDTAALVAGMTAGGWTVLENAHTSVDTVAGAVSVVGLDDPHIDRDDLEAVDRWKPAHGSGEALRLSLVHAPYLRALHAFDAAGADLALAGHTHGGQVAVPVWGALVSNCDLPPRQAKGTSWVGADLPLHVSAGLGHSAYFPFRFACRPELTILDLLPR